MGNIKAHFKKAEIKSLVNMIRLYGKDDKNIARLSLMWKLYRTNRNQNNIKKDLELSTL